MARGTGSITSQEKAGACDGGSLLRRDQARETPPRARSWEDPLAKVVSSSAGSRAPELFATGSSVSFEVRDVLATVPKLPDAMKWAYPHLLQPTTITADIYGHLQESDVFGMRSEV